MIRTETDLLSEKVPASLCWKSWSMPKQEMQRFMQKLVGYGATADAYHITSPIEDGSGAARAMTDAMKEAGAASGGN